MFVFLSDKSLLAWLSKMLFMYLRSTWFLDGKTSILVLIMDIFDRRIKREVLAQWLMMMTSF